MKFQKPLASRYSLLVSLLTMMLFFLFSAEPSHAASYTNIRVRITSDKEKLLLTVKSPYRIEAIHSALLLDKGEHLKHADIIPTNSGIKLNDREFKIYGIRVIPKKDATVFIDGKRFRGIVDIIRQEHLKLTVVNHLDIEKYLYGVLYHEVPHYWPMEVLKAQAIAARTFALYRKELMKDRDYDVTSDIYSQIYGGRASERWRTTKAVKSTKGKILTYGTEILPAYYHSICAGHTEDAKTVFDIDLPPLKGKSCSFCRATRNFYWKSIFSYKQMEERLSKYGIKAKGLNFIADGKRDKSGRLETLKIRDNKGIREIEGFKFRLALGPNIIKSTNFTIEITPKGVVFRGKGWGHGVGMCQWGAFGMARKRFSYKQILQFYYPAAKLEHISKL